MISAQVVVTLVFAPRNAEAGDHGARIDLVFMGEQQVHAALEQRRVMLGNLVEQRKSLTRAIPLVIEVSQLRVEWNAQRLIDHGAGIMTGVSEPEAESEFRSVRKILSLIH